MFQNSSERTLSDIDKKASNEVKVAIKYKGHIEGRTVKTDKNLGKILIFKFRVIKVAPPGGGAGGAQS